MKTQYTAIALVLASGLFASTASFAGLTREPVKTELAQAIRGGDIMAGGESGLKLNELYPNRYQTKQAQAGVAREQVKAELAQAIRSGDIMAGGEVGAQCKEVHLNMHSMI